MAAKQVGLSETATTEQSTSRLKEPKEKVTYNLPRRLRRLIDSTASDLGIPACELVTRLMIPALKGVSRPTIPAALRAQLAVEAESAA